MKESRAIQPPRSWAVLLSVLMVCAPWLAQAQALSGLRVLPHEGPDSSFSGWQSEGAVPAALTVPLELGDEVYGATLQVQPAKAGETYRVRVQYETSLGLSAEGPHLDLTDWKHCVSDWEVAEAVDAVSFVLPTPSAEQHACFPSYTRAELEQAVRAYAVAQGDPAMADDWIPRIGEGDALGTVVPFVAISAVRVRVEVLRKGKWIEVTTVGFLPPMGC
ncbi:hypothetical protein [Pseudoxanthomonas sp. SE1]|uniref:hypothetical protein n=1 Tax=Pseudoxanthomonas sp. SE1 TaxID=1664560 RepID=UPI00240DD1C5|nr:hypothetical protein [Pseudoxanthomonas sp. SE1]WFC43326.1 hypothetical protein OY559_07430 [Pseudoxanthomonas sp. SE1]